MENVNDPNESLKHYDLTDDLIKAWIPLRKKTQISGGLKYQVDITGFPQLFFLKKEGAIFLQLEFEIAGLKIEPQNPRPVGKPIGKCKLPLKVSSEISGGMTIPNDVQMQTEFEGLIPEVETLKTGSFKILIPMTGAIIDDKW